MRYHFKIHKERNGYWAECVELHGCHTQGDSLEELKKNMHEVLNGYLSDPPESKHIFAKPRVNVSGKNVVAISVEPSIAIANRIRELRLRHQLTQVAMKDRLGIKYLSNYQRLEDPQKANPEWSTLCHIKEIFPDFRLDDLFR